MMMPMPEHMEQQMTQAEDDREHVEPAGGGLTWDRLILLAGILVTLAMGAVSLVIGDVEGGIVTGALAFATGLTGRRSGKLGAIGLGLACAITLFFMLTAAVTNIAANSERSAILISAGLAAAALLGLVSALGFLLRGESKATKGPWAGVIASAFLLIGLLIWGSFSAAGVENGTEDVHLVTKNLAFSEMEISTSAGELTVALENQDLFWHTFTIEELGVDLRVPIGAELAVTFEAPPGEYEFTCAIPGHSEAGMRGILTVDE